MGKAHGIGCTACTTFCWRGKWIQMDEEDRSSTKCSCYSKCGCSKQWQQKCSLWCRFFCIRLELLVMLALSLIFILFKVITINYFWEFSSILIILPWSPSKTRILVKSFKRSRFKEVNPPLDVCSNRDSVLSSCVVVFYWSIVPRWLGLYHPLSPCWCRQGSKKEYFSPKPREPPNKVWCGSFFLLFVQLDIHEVY